MPEARVFVIIYLDKNKPTTWQANQQMAKSTWLPDGRRKKLATDDYFLIFICVHL